MSQLSTNVREKRAPKAAPSSVLAVPPREAARLLSASVTRVYQMMRSGELENFHNNASRRVTMRSIEAFIERQLTAANVARQLASTPTRRRRKAG